MSSSVVPNSEIDGPGSARNYTWRIRSLFWYVLTSSAAHYTLLLFPFKKKLKKYTHVLCTFAYSIYSPQAANLIPFSLSLSLSIYLLLSLSYCEGFSLRRRLNLQFQRDGNNRTRSGRVSESRLRASVSESSRHRCIRQWRLLRRFPKSSPAGN